jgi:hypothetical protein
MSEVTWEYRPFIGPAGDGEYLQVPDGGPRIRPYKIAVTFINRRFFSATITGIDHEQALSVELHGAIEALPSEVSTHWTVRYTNLRELPDWAKPYTLWENLT